VCFSFSFPPGNCGEAPRQFDYGQALGRDTGVFWQYEFQRAIFIMNRLASFFHILFLLKLCGNATIIPAKARRVDQAKRIHHLLV
jgi:hypothetical protein